MSRKLMFVSFLALATTCGGAMAQNASEAMPAPAVNAPKVHPGHDWAQKRAQKFDAMDANHDGVLEKSEVSGHLAARFDEIDANHDGKITRDELRAAHKAHSADRRADRQSKRMERADTNHDGKLSWAEVEAEARARFDKADTNHDGFLDASERAAAHHGRGHKTGDHAPHRHADASGKTAGQ
ncbi:EF-hand domain-containing protein [Asticcacaulis sp. 201]|uniref:EF-hand domain-containing protein n=1 Tax=Asticcacaulis sp. 201 TaxID=3028787 RepID=UPI00291612E4|nr:EF-hand domain-containing protein [Asticcacaulis sp. 201]MDV6331984.1 EF-hand domain-containing protein [Asticcacaulis sp. 201]